LGKNAWSHFLGNGRIVGDTRGTRSPTRSYCVANRSPQVVNKLGLSFSSTKQLNDIIDKELPGRPPFETRSLVIGGETLELHFRNILACIRCIYSDPEFTQDLAVAPERHYADQEKTARVFNEMYTGDWWWAVQVHKSMLHLE
jgi:hypothetical protein